MEFYQDDWSRSERSLSLFSGLVRVRFFAPFEVQSTVAESTDAIGAVVVSCWAPSFIELIELVARLATSLLAFRLPSLLRNRISISAPSPLVFDNKGNSSCSCLFFSLWTRIDGDLAVEHENWLSIPQVRHHVTRRTPNMKRRRSPISQLGAHLTERCGYDEFAALAAASGTV